MDTLGAVDLTEQGKIISTDYREAMLSQANLIKPYSVQIEESFIRQYNEIGRLEDSQGLLDKNIAHTISSSYEKVLEAEKVAQRNFLDTYETNFIEKIQASIISPAKGYIEQMQTILNEPMLKMQEYADIGLNSIKELQKLHLQIDNPYKIELERYPIQELTNSMTEIMKGFSVEDRGHLSASTYDSYKSIHNILDNDVFSSIIPKNIDSLVKGIIDTESMTQHYFDRIPSKVMDVTIEEYDVWSELEIIRTDIIESVKGSNQEVEEKLNQILKVVNDLVLSQTDPKIILSIFN